MEVEKTEKNITEDDECKIIYRGWKVMPFIIGTKLQIVDPCHLLDNYLLNSNLERTRK